MNGENNKNTMRSFRLDSDVVRYIDELVEMTKAEKEKKGKTEIVEQAIRNLHKAYSFRKLWGFGSAEQINLMLADFPEKAKYANPAFEGSVVAIGTLAPAITLANEEKVFNVHMHNYQIPFYGNLLLVGGPKRNNVTKFFLEETELSEKAKFDRWGLKFDGEEYVAKFDNQERAEEMDRLEEERDPEKEVAKKALEYILESHLTLIKLHDKIDEPYREEVNGIIKKHEDLIEANPERGGLLHVEKDYGLLLKAPNPLDTENTVMIIAGCRGFGTGGAASVVADRKMSKDIVKELGEDKCQYFRAVVEVLVRNDVIAKREIVKLEALDGKQG